MTMVAVSLLWALTLADPVPACPRCEPCTPIIIHYECSVPDLLPPSDDPAIPGLPPPSGGEHDPPVPSLPDDPPYGPVPRDDDPPVPD